MTQETSQGPGFMSRLLRAFRNLVIAAVVFSSLGAALYAVSMLNTRSYALEIQSGQLVVMKGRLAPWGHEPWQPEEAGLAEAYAPVPLQGNMPVGVTQVKYEDRDALDRALFPVLELLARPRIASEGPAELQQGLAFVKRAQKLSGITQDQRAALKTMETDVSFFLARSGFEEAQRQLEVALQQLRMASGVDARHSKEANRMLTTVEPHARALDEALKRAVNELSAPAEKQPVPEVKPTTPV